MDRLNPTQLSDGQAALCYGTFAGLTTLAISKLVTGRFFAGIKEAGLVSTASTVLSLRFPPHTYVANWLASRRPHKDRPAFPEPHAGAQFASASEYLPYYQKVAGELLVNRDRGKHRRLAPNQLATLNGEEHRQLEGIEALTIQWGEGDDVDPAELIKLLASIKDIPVIAKGLTNLDLSGEQKPDLAMLCNGYFPALTSLTLPHSVSAQMAQQLAAACPNLQSLRGVQLDAKARQVLAERCPRLRWETSTVYLPDLSEASIEALQDRQRLQTVVIAAAGCQQRVLDLSGLPECVVSEILGQVQGLSQLTLDQASDWDIRCWHQWGWLDTVQKLDLPGCSRLTTDVMHTLIQCPHLSIIDLPKELPLGKNQPPHLTNPVLIRELVTKQPAFWQGKHHLVKCAPFWASIHKLESEVAFGPSENALGLAQQTVAQYLVAVSQQGKNGDVLSVIELMRAFKTATETESANVAVQECCIWLIQGQLKSYLWQTNGLVSLEKLDKLWTFATKGKAPSKAALRCSLRLFAESNCPEWVLNRPELTRFDPNDSYYCDFTVTRSDVPDSPIYLHKQVLAARSRYWERNIQNAVTSTTPSGLLGEPIAGVSPEVQTNAAPIPITSTTAFVRYFELLYDRTAEVSPDEADEVSVVADAYQDETTVNACIRALSRKDVNRLVELALKPGHETILAKVPAQLSGDCSSLCDLTERNKRRLLVKLLSQQPPRRLGNIVSANLAPNTRASDGTQLEECARIQRTLGDNSLIGKLAGGIHGHITQRQQSIWRYAHQGRRLFRTIWNG